MFGEDIGTYSGYFDEVVLRKYLELINEKREVSTSEEGPFVTLRG